MKKEAKNYFSVPHYILLMIVCTILRLRFHARSRKSAAFKAQKKKGAMLVLANHVSALDFGYFSPPFFPKKLSFVVAENMMYSTPIFAKVIKGYHAITKKQFFADFTCIKSMKKYLDAGISVLICPEGKVAADGKTGPIPPSIAKLVKWLGYPVATVITKGGGLTRPKWAYNGRTGKVVCDLDMLYTADEVKALSQSRIMEDISAALSHNEYLWQIENHIKFRGKRYAEGLERLLYKCPNCGSEFTQTTAGDYMTCSVCNNKVRVLHTGELMSDNEVCPARIDVWSEWEKQEVAKEISSDDFVISKPVNLFLENETKNGYRFVSKGTLTLDKTNLTFVSTQDMRPKNVETDYKISAMLYDADELGGGGEPVEEEFKRLQFPIKNFVTIANIPGDSLDLYDEKHTYRMMFSAEKASTKYVYAIEEMNR